MLWFPLALAGAFCQAAYGLSIKVLLRKIPPFPLAGFSFLAASAILFLISVLTGIPALGPELPLAIAVTVAINILATILFYRALAVTDLSLCYPMLAFTPVFLILTSYLILGEIPSPAGAAGILLVASGAWLLALEYENGRPVSLAGPFRILHANRGVQAMLLVAFLYSISVNYDKQVVENSNPIFGSAIVLLLLGLAFLLLAVISRQKDLKSFQIDGSLPEKNLSGTGKSPSSIVFVRPSSRPKDPAGNACRPARRGPGLPAVLSYPAIGLILALEAVTINTAYTLTIVPYVITVKRLSIFFSVLFGGLLLHEQQLRGRLTGASVMIIGAVVIGLFG